MQNYNVTAVLDSLPDDDVLIGEVLAAFDPYHGALTWPIPHETHLIITVPAESIRQATSTAYALLAAAELEPRALSVETTERFDRLAGGMTVPDLVSAPEAAEILGISPQAVRLRIASGTLRGIRVGDAWVLVRAEVMAAADRDRG